MLAGVREKNWLWHKHFKIPNGVHVYGRRYKPFGPVNYPPEIAKMRAMTEMRDRAIWANSKGLKFDIASADKSTPELPDHY